MELRSWPVRNILPGDRFHILVGGYAGYFKILGSVIFKENVSLNPQDVHQHFSEHRVSPARIHELRARWGDNIVGIRINRPLAWLAPKWLKKKQDSKPG